MSAATTRVAPRSRVHPAQAGRPGRARPARPLAGTATMVAVVLRRNWARLVSWWVFVVGLLVYVVHYYSQTFTTQKSLDEFATVAASPGMRALTGVAAQPATLGGAVWTKIWMTLAIGLAFGVVFLVTRNGRADEEAGRAELLRSRVLGIHASSVATTLVVGGLCVAGGVCAALVCAAMGLDPDGAGHAGSWLFGLSVTGTGLVALGLAAVAGQVASTSRGANALASAALGVAYLLRMAGDLGSGWLVWTSPIGWGQETRPWGPGRWWPLALQVGLAVLLLCAAALLEERRDHGAGLLPERPGPSGAPAWWASPAGLALRLERGPVIGWFVALVASGLMLGSVVSSMADLVRDAPPQVAAYIGEDGMDGLVAMLARILALLVAVFALQTTLPLRADEASGLLEAQLGRAVSRRAWVLGRLVVPVVGSAVLLAVSGAAMGVAYGAALDQPGEWTVVLGATVAYWPAVMVLVGCAATLFGLVPRAATVLTWGLLVLMWLVEMVGDTGNLPERVLDATPMRAVPSMPSEPMDWAPLLVLTVVAAALVAVGVAGLRRRDVQVG